MKQSVNQLRHSVKPHKQQLKLSICWLFSEINHLVIYFVFFLQKVNQVFAAQLELSFHFRDACIDPTVLSGNQNELPSTRWAVDLKVITLVCNSLDFLRGEYKSDLQIHTHRYSLALLNLTLPPKALLVSSVRTGLAETQWISKLNLHIVCDVNSLLAQIICFIFFMGVTPLYINRGIYAIVVLIVSN